MLTPELLRLSLPAIVSYGPVLNFWITGDCRPGVYYLVSMNSVSENQTGLKYPKTSHFGLPGRSKAGLVNGRKDWEFRWRASWWHLGRWGGIKWLCCILIYCLLEESDEIVAGKRTADLEKLIKGRKYLVAERCSIQFEKWTWEVSLEKWESKE